jgi:hypothetical protein
MAPGHQGQPGEAAKDGHGETKASVFGKASWPCKMNEEKKKYKYMHPQSAKWHEMALNVI